MSVLLFFRCEAHVVFREVTREILLRFVLAIVLYLCQSHKSVLLSREADFSARQC